MLYLRSTIRFALFLLGLYAFISTAVYNGGILWAMLAGVLLTIGFEVWVNAIIDKRAAKS